MCRLNNKVCTFYIFLMLNKAIKTPCHYQILENTNHQNGSGPIGSDKGGGGMLPFFFN